MKRSIQEISMGGGTFDEPEGSGGGQPQHKWAGRMAWKPGDKPGAGQPPKNKWAGRMAWKPHGNPLLHPDEEAALAGGPTDMPAADELLDRPPTVAPHVGNVQPVRNDLHEPETEIPIRQMPAGRKSRFDMPKPEMEPMRFAGAADIDALMAEIRAEEAKPPHQQNAAKLTRLKADAMELMSQEESRQVQRMADRLLPRLEG